MRRFRKKRKWEKKRGPPQLRNKEGREEKEETRPQKGKNYKEEFCLARIPEFQRKRGGGGTHQRIEEGNSFQREGGGGENKNSQGPQILSNLP